MFYCSLPENIKSIKFIVQRKNKIFPTGYVGFCIKQPNYADSEGQKVCH